MICFYIIDGITCYYSMMIEFNRNVLLYIISCRSHFINMIRLTKETLIAETFLLEIYFFFFLSANWVLANWMSSTQQTGHKPLKQSEQNLLRLIETILFNILD